MIFDVSKIFAWVISRLIFLNVSKFCPNLEDRLKIIFDFVIATSCLEYNGGIRRPGINHPKAMEEASLPCYRDPLRL